MLPFMSAMLHFMSAMSHFMCVHVHPLIVVSCYRYSQLQTGENDSILKINVGPNICKPVLHPAISNIVQRHVALHERHVAAHVRNLALHAGLNLHDQYLQAHVPVNKTN